ncbi:MAG: PTS sugar transporter subunit IIA [Fusobacteriaceae bacterium]
MQIIKITDYLEENLINLDLNCKNKDEALKELSGLIGKSQKVINKKELYDALVEREKIGSTGIGKGVAIPHAKTEAASELIIAFGKNSEKLEFDSLDGEGTNLFFVFASPSKDSQIYLKVLARISRLIREEKFRERLIGCKSPKEVIEAIKDEEWV